MSGRMFLVLGLVPFLAFGTSGCFFKRPAQADKAQELKVRALKEYVENTNAVHRAEQEAYRAEAKAHAQSLFNQGLAQVKAKAGPDGKVDAAEVVAWVQQLASERAQYEAKADTKVQEIKVVIAKADEDMYTALKLDALLERFNESGVDPAFAQSAMNSILEITRRK